VECIFESQPQLQSFIIDSEIVAIEPADGGLKSFQELSNRARTNVAVNDIQVSVCVFAFDLLNLDGEVRPSNYFRYPHLIAIYTGLACPAISRTAFAAQTSLSAFATK